MLGDEALHGVLGVFMALGLDGDVGRGAAYPGGGLVHHDPRVRQAVALALRPDAEQELAHARGETHGHGRDVVGDEAHRVVDRHPGRHRTTR